MGEVIFESPDRAYADFLEYAKGSYQGGWPLSASVNALTNVLLVKAGRGWLYGFSGFNNKASAQFIQVHDANSIPADGAVPVFVMTAATVANFSVVSGSTNRKFQRGIVICNSSTAATKTIASSDCWIDAQYL